ncbi:NAD(P)-dependent oxidoreductase [Streptomyces chartreusis]|uniref:NAD(P)-dependent oxidoreductase n=1 Tax=Streptomyces chartreusis TaxID=1969 RepID=UPI00362CEBFA
MTTVGFLGLGSMGSAIARRLLAQAHDVVVWNRSPAPVAELVEAGARAAASPREALATPVSFTMLANDAAIDSILTAEHLEDSGGGVHICLASVSPTAADRAEAVCHQSGVEYLSAPVLGRPAVAAEGKLNVLVGGPTDTLRRVDHLLSVIGTRTWHVSEVPRAANVVKTAVNYNIIHALQALAESTAMVERHGGDATGFVELLHETLFGGVVYEGYGRMIAERTYQPVGFVLDLGLKDLHLAESVAHEVHLTLPTAPTLRRMFEEALADPALHDSDWSAIAEITRRNLQI